MYPGAALTTALIAYAEEQGRLPSEVYRDYLDNKFDYHLIFAYKTWRSETEREEIEKAKRGR